MEQFNGKTYQQQSACQTAYGSQGPDEKHNTQFYVQPVLAGFAFALVSHPWSKHESKHYAG